MNDHNSFHELFQRYITSETYDLEYEWYYKNTSALASSLENIRRPPSDLIYLVQWTDQT